MIQLNLLPDVKLQYIKAQRSRRLVFTIAFISSSVSLAILVLMLLGGFVQKKHLGDLNHDIAAGTSQLQHKPNINQILTVQNQLKSLTKLHSGKSAANRLFDYLNDVTQTQVSITTFTIDFTTQVVSITGTADALSSVNTYINTLKTTTYTTETSSTAVAAFSDVVLTNFALTSGQQSSNNQPATFTITLANDKNIFDITQKPKLIVPAQVSTRVTAGGSTDLFQKAPEVHDPTTSTTGSGGRH